MNVKRQLIERVVVTVPMDKRDQTMAQLDALGFEFVRVGPALVSRRRVDPTRARMVYQRVLDQTRHRGLTALQSAPVLPDEEAADALD